MQTVASSFLRHLRTASRSFVDVVEFYKPNEINITDADAPARAIGRFSQYCVTWNGFEYQPYLKGGIGDIKYTMTRETNSGTLKFSNINREMTAWALNNTVQGMRVTVRRVYRNDPTGYQIIAANLRARRPKGFNYSEFTVDLAEDDGGLNRKIPRRSLGKSCPLDFGGALCLNCQSLSQKSIAYQTAWNDLGEDGCDKTYETCSSFDNVPAYQGLRFQVTNGSLSYQESVTKKVLFFFKKTKTTTINVPYSSQNIDSDNDVVGMVFGRSQIVAKPLQWVDTGAIIQSLQMLCEGPIASVYEIHCRTNGLNASGAPTIHSGTCGGTFSQTPDPRFPNSGYFSRLAYFGENTAGSDAKTTGDGAPTYTALVRGFLFDLPDGDGKFTKHDWTDIGPYMVRGLYLDSEFGAINRDYWEDDATIAAARICEQIIEDRTNTERSVLPQAEQPNYGATFRRFRSTGITTGYGYRRALGQESQDSLPEDLQDAYIDWIDPYYPPVAVLPIVYLRRRFTTNVWLHEQVALKDFIQKTILPSFMGYLAVNSKGKTEVRVERAVDFAFTRQAVAPGETLLPVDSIAKWVEDTSGFVIVGNGTQNAEPHRITGYRYSVAGNDIVLAASANGDLTATSAGGFAGGNLSNPATATIVVTGTVSLYSQIKVTIDGIDCYYTCDAGDTIESATLMLAAQINAQPTISRLVFARAVLNVAETGGNGVSATLLLTATSGFLELETPLKHSHEQFEENIRVAYVFEDCGDLKLDNIKRGSFRWNDEEHNDTTRISTTFINAVDDFAVTNLERKARNAERILGTQNTYQFDGSGVDSWNQILRLTKSKLIEFRDCDFIASLESYGEATLLECGDVVAVRHTSGDSRAGLAVNYMPLRIRELTHTALQTVKLKLQLYLSAQYNDEVRKSSPTVHSTLTTDANAGQNSPPPSQGTAGTTTGGTSGSTQTIAPTNVHTNYGYGYTKEGGYSPTGADVGSI